MTVIDEHAPEMDERELAAGLAQYAELASELDPLIEERVVAPAIRRRRRRARLGIGVVAAVAAGTVVVAVAALAPGESTESTARDGTGSSSVPSSAAATFAVTPPLSSLQAERALADLVEAAARVGTTSQADFYANVTSDPCRCSITVYLTDLTRREAFLTDLRTAFPDADRWQVNFAPARHNQAACNAIFVSVNADLNARQLPFRVNVMSMELDCSVIHLRVDAVETARAYLENPANGFTSQQVAIVPESGPKVSFMDTQGTTG